MALLSYNAFFSFKNDVFQDILDLNRISILHEKRDLFQSYDKIPTPTEYKKTQSGNTKTPPKHSIETAIANRLRAVRWSNNSHPTCLVKQKYGIPTFTLTVQAVKSKGHTYYLFYRILLKSYHQQPTTVYR